MKKWKALIAALLMTPLVACGANAELKPYQGHWVDVNGSTTLDLSGSKLTVTCGDWVEKYTVKAVKTESQLEIQNTEDAYGIGIMSSLSVNSEGHLVAYEQVMDAAGHTYVFVREEELEKERAIEDLSEAASKEIVSTEITEFSLYFDTFYGRKYDLDEAWPSSCRYSLEIDKDEDDGQYFCRYSEEYESYMGRSYDGPVDEAFIQELEQVILDNNLARLNGYYFKNNVKRGSYSLYVTYASEEEIKIRAEGDAADTCPFPLTPIMNLVQRLLDSQDVSD